MKRLHQLLDQQRKEAVAAALETGGEVEKEKLEKLERLAKLAAEAGHLSRNVVIGVVAALAVILALALILEPPSTDIDLDLKVTAFAFTLPQSQLLMGQPEAKAVSAGPLDRIELADTGESFSTGSCFLALDSESRGLTLQPFQPPPGTIIRLTRQTNGMRWRFNAGKTTPTDPVQITVEQSARLNITCGGGAPVQRALTGPAIIRAYPPAEFGLTVDTPKPVFEREVAIANLALFEEVDQGEAAPRVISGLLGGTVYFNDLNGKTMALRPSETLQFRASAGELRAVAAKPDEEGLQLQARLTVQGMSSGSGSQRRRSRMPNWVDRAYANESLVRLGLLIPGAGLLYSLLRWFKLAA